MRSSASSMEGAKVCFIDLPTVGSQLMPGRPFAMVEGESGKILTLESPITGEVAEVNERLLREPELVVGSGYGAGGSDGRDSGGGGGGGDGWLVRVDPFLDRDDEDLDFDAMLTWKKDVVREPI